MDYKEEEENIPDCRLSNVIQLQRRRITKKYSDQSSLEVGRTLKKKKKKPFVRKLFHSRGQMKINQMYTEIQYTIGKC